EAQHAAGRHLEAQVVDRDEGSVRLAQLLDADHEGPSSITAKWSLPTSSASSRCRSGPPSTSFTWVASAGSCSKTASALTHSPSHSSFQACHATEPAAAA